LRHEIVDSLAVAERRRAGEPFLMLDPNAYPVGVTVMDHQHCKLLGLINQLADPDANLKELLAAYNAYAEQHFNVEESLMEAHEYPARSVHISAHEAYRRRFKGLMADALTGSPVLIKAMQTFLEHWWVEHIGGVDRRLADYLCEQGMHRRAA
jgi:hemerythrin